MMSLKYPSKEFAAAWREAVNDEAEFSIDAKIGIIRKKSIKKWIDSVFLGKKNQSRFGILGIIFGGDLTSCISTVFVAKKYKAEYLDTEKGLLITFYRKT